MVVTTERWERFVREAVVRVVQGYTLYVHIVVPPSKADRTERVVKKLVERYPEIEYGYTTRHRRKKRGEANVSLIRWDRQILVMRTLGELRPRENEDTFSSIDQDRLIIRVGEYVQIRIGRSSAGRAYTAYLAQDTYRWLRDALVGAIAHRRTALAEHLWANAQDLPAFSGILGQMRDLHRRLRRECRRHGVRVVLPQVALRPIYRSSPPRG